MSRDVLKSFFTIRWILTTLLVIAAVGVMIRLGFWQLDRLQQRRAFNTSVEAQMSAGALDLNQSIPLDQLKNMEYRQVVAHGTYDFQNEMVLRNQVNNDQPGYHLLTPLRIQDSAESILVDRGFIPLEDAKPQARAKYAQTGPVTVHGIIRLGHVPQFFGVPDPTLAPGQTRLDAWNYINIDRIQGQLPYKSLPVYIQAAPDPATQTGPIAAVDQPDLTEGPHLGYAIQWFSFAAVLGLGYPYFVRKQLLDGARTAQEKGSAPGRTGKA